MAPPGQQELLELNLGRVGGRLPWRLWGLPRPGPQSASLHPVGMPPSRKTQEGVGVEEAHAAKQLPDAALTLCVS